MRLKSNVTEFRSMLRDCDGELPKLTRLIRNRLRLNQEALGALTGVHRNAITRLENGRSNHPVRWVRELFFVLLACRDETFGKEIRALRDHAKKRSPVEATEETGPLFGKFVELCERCSGNVAALSREIRRRYGLTQEDLAELLESDRTTVTHLEGAKHKYPERLLADLYIVFLLLNDRELKEEVYSLKHEKVKSTAQGRAGKRAAERPKESGAPGSSAMEEDARYAEQAVKEGTTTRELAAAPSKAGSSNEPASEVTKPYFDEESNLKKYGFRTRQELYGVMRSEDLTPEEKRRLSIIDDRWTEDLKKRDALKVVRMQMQTVRARVTRELYDRGHDNQAVFIKASNSYKKGLSIAEISQEHNGYLSLPFCSFWEKRGFDPVKFLTWKPTNAEVYEIYMNFEPEFKINSLEYRFRPKKNLPPDQTSIVESSKSLTTLLKEWFPQIADEIRD